MDSRVARISDSESFELGRFSFRVPRPRIKSCSERCRASECSAHLRATDLRSLSSSSVSIKCPRYQPLGLCVPTTRARIFAKASNRVVDVSSLNGEKPQSSVVITDRMDVSGCLQDSVTNLLRCIDVRVDGGDDAGRRARIGSCTHG